MKGGMIFLEGIDFLRFFFEGGGRDDLLIK